MAKQTPAQQLEQINKLLEIYILNGNRKVLSQVRNAVPILLRSAPTMSVRLRETFNEHNLSMSIL